MSVSPKIFKQVRKALGLTQQELADALGLSRVTVNKMEQGRLKRGIPDEIASRLLALRSNVKPNPFDAATPHMVECYERNVRSGHAKPVDNHLWDNEEDES